MAANAVELPLGTLAAEFGMSRDVLRRIVAEAGVAPVGRRSGHPIYRLREVYAAVQAQHSPDAMNPHARLALARAIKTEDEIRARRGELIESWDHEQRVGALAKLVVRVLESAPDVLERDVGLTPLQAARLERHLDEIREHIAREWMTEASRAAGGESGNCVRTRPTIAARSAAWSARPSKDPADERSC